MYSIFRTASAVVLLGAVLPALGQDIALARQAQPTKSSPAKTETQAQLALEKVLKEIQTRQNVFFNYSNALVQDKLVTVNLKDITPENLLPYLTELLRPLGLQIEKQPRNRYLIYQIETKKAGPTSSLLNNRIPEETGVEKPSFLWRITGRVVSDKGDPIPGTSVVVKGTSTGSVTANDGTYTVNAPESPGVLVFTSVGYTTQEIPFTNATVVNATLVEDIRALDEVVVTGYTKEQKKDIVGAVNVVNTQDLQAQAAFRVTDQLQGRASGVTVIRNSGDPSASPSVRIRGVGSFGNTDPLYVVDGVPASNIDSINPNDIESLQVLKDAAAAAIYGSRAANGVIIITTKRGKAGTLKVNVDSYYGVSYVDKSHYPELLNTQEYGDLLWKAYAGAGLKVGDKSWGNRQYGYGATPVIPEYIYAGEVSATGVKSIYGGADLELLKTTNKAKFDDLVNPANYSYTTHQIVKSGDTNWSDAIFGTPAPVQNYQVSLSGGSDKGTFVLSLNYRNEASTRLAKILFYKRYTMRVNTAFNVSKRIRIGENLQVSYINNLPTGSVPFVQQPQALMSIIPVHDIAGNPASTAAPDTGNQRNSVTEAETHAKPDRYYTYGMFGNLYLEADVFKGLTARTSFGIDMNNAYSSNYTSRTYDNSEPTNTYSLSVSNNTTNNWTWTNTLTYDHTFAERHQVRVLLGTEAVNNFTDFLTGGRQDFAVDPLHPDPNFVVLSSGTAAQSNTGTFTRQTLYSIFGRVDYNFSGKYLINATLRRDGSSRFGINNRFGTFPSVGAAWRISAENFMKGINWLSDLKLRGSWGNQGNQSGLTANNQYTTFASDINNSYPLTGSNSNSTLSYRPSTLGNPSAQWEKTTTTDFGLDASLFANSLDVTMDWYTKRTTGLLVVNQAPLTGSSATQPSVNIGDMNNKGFELAITKRGNLLKGFRYEAGLQFTRERNKVLRVLDSPTSFLSSNGSRQRTQAGLPYNYYYGYTIDGFFNTQEEVDSYKNVVTQTWIPPALGRWKIKDINGDNKIDAADQTMIGNPYPKFTMGFSLSLSYKNFDLRTLLYWVNGVNNINAARDDMDFFNSDRFNRSKRMLYESWTPELGNNAKLPKLDINDTFSRQNTNTSYFIEDASYLQLQNLQIGYNVPRVLLTKVKMSNLRIYVQSQNLFTLTKFSGMSPTVGNNTNPIGKQLLVGINLGF